MINVIIMIIIIIQTAHVWKKARTEGQVINNNNYLTMKFLLGSGYAIVPISDTTILFAAIFAL